MIQVIPAIDLIAGKCVRLSQGDYGRRTDYDANPVDMAKLFLDSGLNRIHIVDLEGAKAKEPKNLSTLEKIARLDGVEIEWGGGIKTDDAIRDVFNAGATFAIIGSIAVSTPHKMMDWLEKYGGDRLILGADVRGDKVAISGWLEDTSMTIDELLDLFIPCGLTQTICTDIAKDGMLDGPSDALYVRLRQSFPQIEFTVSGGISSIADIDRLDELGLPRVITGKALYEGLIPLSELKRYAR